MNINQLADIYVDVVEPLLKIGAFIILVVVVLHGFNIIKYGGSGSSLVGRTYVVLVTWFGKLLVILQKLATIVMKLIVSYTHVLLATVKDFLSSRN
jgi:hypothetical protein